MSTRPYDGTATPGLPAGHGVDIDRHRLGALVGLGLLTLALHRILYTVSDGRGALGLLAVVGLSVVAAYVADDRLRPRQAAAAFATIAIVSYLWYFAIVANDVWLLVEAPARVLIHTVDDAMAIGTGQSVLAIAQTDAWARAFAPGPVFLLWYLGFRRRYALAAGVGGATMLVFVFSGDLGWWWTLVGTIGIVTAVGFGTIELAGASGRHVEWLLVVIALMALAAVAVPLVPGGGMLEPLSLVDADDEEFPGNLTGEAAIVGSGDELRLVGEINNSPEIRYTVHAEDPVYLRTGVYDNYTGAGVERSGDVEAFGPPDRFPQEAGLVTQTVRTAVETDRLPAATQPVSIAGVDGVQQSEHGSITTDQPVEDNTTYTVVSAVPTAPTDPATATVPDTVDERYTALPEDVPDRVHSFAGNVTAGATGPIESAERIETVLERSKGYSQDVEVPDGDVTDAFLHEMEAGYCSFFATSMMTMLRTQDIPARMAVGYAHGQSVDQNTSVLRSFNSHAWVEVYVEDHGWVLFDPTPTGDRVDTRGDILEDAREGDLPGIDTNDTADLPLDHDPTPDDADNNTDGGSDNGTDGNVSDGEPDGPDPPRGGGSLPDRGDTGEIDEDRLEELILALRESNDDDDEDPAADTTAWYERPEPEHLGVFGLVFLGTVAGARRARVGHRLSRQGRHRWHLSSAGPRGDLRRSADRLEWALTRRFRPRRPGETFREYHDGYRTKHRDDRVDRLFELIEAGAYAGDIDDERAAEAVELADQVVTDTVVFGGTLRPSVPSAPGSLVDRIL